MYRRIVVAYNAGNEGRDALALAARLARPERARIVVVQTMPACGGWDVAREAATRMTAARASIATIVEPGLEVEYRPLVASPFTPSIHAEAAREEADLIVVGQSRLGPVARTRVGGGADALLARSRWPVAVAAPEQAQRGPFDARTIGVGFDGSPGSALALCAAADLARWLDADLRVVTVGGSGRTARAAAVRLAGEVRAEVVAPVGDPARALPGQAADGVDALVVGHRVRRPPGRPGVSLRVMGSAGCPVWVVPPAAAGLVLRRRAVAAAA
jgi:nucleotide-binding universal stress UspA family protein